MEKIIIKKNEDGNKNPSSNSIGDHIVGTYGGFNIILKNGRFGKYIVWGKNGIHRKSIEKTHIQNKDYTSISLDEVIRFIENDLADHNGDNSASASATTTSGGEGGIVRIINDDISIRSGKYGNYIFYKTVQMKKPKFVSLKNFNKNIYTCSDTEFISLVNV